MNNKYIFSVIICIFSIINANKIKAQEESQNTCETITEPNIQEDNFDVLLSEIETKYVYKGEKESRAANVELAASKIHEIIIKPGEIFSYNKIVGNRTHVNGFKDAPVIVNNELVDGIGGGVCQVAGTLHSAALWAGLEIVESTQHSRTSTYIDPGFDSTVAWGQKDFKFRNWFPTSIKVTVETFRDEKKGHIVVRIWGAQKYYNVEMESIIHRKSGVVTKVIYREDLPKTYRKIIEVGTPTVSMTRIRKLHNDNEYFEESLDLFYAASTRIIEIGRQNIEQ